MRTNTGPGSWDDVVAGRDCYHNVSSCCEAELTEIDPIQEDHCSSCDKPLSLLDLEVLDAIGPVPREHRVCGDCQEKRLDADLAKIRKSWSRTAKSA